MSQFTTQMRFDNNRTYILPSCMVFIFKAIQPTSKTDFEVLYTLNLWIKVNGIPEPKETMDWMEKNLRVRINEKEVQVDALQPDYKRIRSQHATEADDILVIRIRGALPLQYDVNTYKLFPFETIQAKFRYELSHFELNGLVYRFDVYWQDNPALVVKKDVDRCGVYDIDYSQVKIEIINENKGGAATDYYPGQTYVFPLVRDSATEMFNIFLPVTILLLFNSFVGLTVEFDNLVANVSIVMLAFMQFVGTLKQDLPPIPKLTFAEKVIYFEMFLLLIPLARAIVMEKMEPQQKMQFVIGMLVLSMAPMIYVVFKFCKQWKKLYQTPPPQIKGDGNAAAPDKKWLPPNYGMPKFVTF